MKIKKSNLEWNVLHYDCTRHKVVNYDIMTGIAELVAREVRRKKIQNKADLKEFLKREFMYHFWSRTEAEMFVTGYDGEYDLEKVDIWRQIEMNLDRIVDYINSKCELNLK
jgi:hypothetical protein